MTPDHYMVRFDPVAISLGPLDLHWYGIMYLLGFGAFWAIGRWRAKHQDWRLWTPDQVSDFLFYGMLGVVIGGRLGYVLIYGFDQLLADPLFLFRFKDGGMSFHGGLAGVLLAMAWYGRRQGRDFWWVADFVAPIVPLGLFFGRMGNFIGGELWGRASDAPWAMIFPNALQPDGWRSAELYEAWQAGQLDEYARHPSQLYQAGLEGLALFVLLMAYSRRPRAAGEVSGWFLVGYGTFRFIAEFFREPDRHLGYLAGDWLTMGMLLSLPMVLAGVALILLARRGVLRRESAADGS